MRVAIDTNALFTTQAGVSRHIRGLLGALRDLKAPDLELVPLAWPVENFQYRQPQRALKTFYRELIWAKVAAPYRLAWARADLLHSPAGFLIRPPAGIPNVITLHDLAVIRFPQRFRRWQRSSTRRRLSQLRRARRVICISRFTAREAMELLALPAARLEVIHNGCDFMDPQRIPAEQKPVMGLPTEFFLFVGSLEPGKNLPLLREAYGLAESRGLRLPPLVIVGARWEGVGHEGQPPAGWHYLGRQPDEVLVYLYRRAAAFLFPTLYEGFGLPVLEAMSLGCPVICSPVASLPEVGGEAALFVEQTPSGYLTAMQTLAANPALRADLAGKGLVQARQFSWQRCAEQTLAVYRSALA
jgi:glycosyltransferase involved in cell wall biosynthesis